MPRGCFENGVASHLLLKIFKGKMERNDLNAGGNSGPGEDWSLCRGELGVFLLLIHNRGKMNKFCPVSAFFC